MPNIQSAIKRARQNVKRQARNRMAKSTMRTAIRRVESALSSGDAATADASFRSAESQIASKGRKGLIHWRAAARKTSRLAKRLNKVRAEQAQA